MRLAILAIVATLGAATLTGPAQAAACPAGWYWVPGHYHWGEFWPGHCRRISATRAMLSAQAKRHQTALPWGDSAAIPPDFVNGNYRPDYGLFR